MRFEKDSLSRMAEREYFINVFTRYADFVLAQGRLAPVFSKPRLSEAHGAWRMDIRRLTDHERNLNQEDGLDHFKQAGHLAYWIRRMAPVIEAADTTQNLGDAPGYPIDEQEKAFRQLMLGYCNEYLAFDIGFHLVKLHEVDPNNPNCRASKIFPSQNYIHRLCNFLKYKHVSPHALHLIFTSLFFET